LRCDKAAAVSLTGNSTRVRLHGRQICTASRDKTFFLEALDLPSFNVCFPTLRESIGMGTTGDRRAMDEACFEQLPVLFAVLLIVASHRIKVIHFFLDRGRIIPPMDFRDDSYHLFFADRAYDFFL
jgi:hypothetical protein